MQSYQRSETPATDVQDQPAARALLAAAFAKTYRWPAGFKGFAAEVAIEEAGRRTTGAVEVRSAREVTVTLSDEALQKWAEGQIAMMAVHRGPRTFEESDGKYALTLAPEDGHPLGRGVVINGDGMGSLYRIRDERITQINRRMERMAFTINVDDALATTDGRHLTTRYTVYYFAPADARLTNVESFHDQPAVVNGVYLPGSRLLTFAENGQVVVRRTTFTQHRLL